MSFGLTPEGFVPKSLEDVLNDVVTRQRADLGPDIDTSPFSVLGQLNGVFASKLVELWESGQELYDALDPDMASGVQQDALYSLTNTLRRDAKKSTVVATVNLSAATTIAAGDAVASVQGNPVARFVNVEPMLNPGGAPANVSVLFESEVGPVVANATTLNVIETFIAGWNSITNAEDAALGSFVETDAAYRIRRLAELAAAGGGTVNGIRADLSRLPDVVAVAVLENVTDVTTADGLPPHSIEAIVRGGDAQAIGESIATNKVGGIQTHGTEPPVEVVDEQGETYEIYFSRPDEVTVFLAIDVVTGPEYVGDEALALALQAATTNKLDPAYLDVGTDVYSGQMVRVALRVPGVLNASVGLSLTVISDPGAGQPSIAIASRQLAIVLPANIAVTEFTQ
jgi:uncharacterized phage protein gp47/JayE